MTKERLITPGYCFIIAANFLLYFGFYLLMPVFPFYLTEVFHTGSATMGIETRKVAASFDDYGGDLSIDYVVNMEHTVASRNKLNMSVRLRS